MEAKKPAVSNVKSLSSQDRMSVEGTEGLVSKFEDGHRCPQGTKMNQKATSLRSAHSAKNPASEDRVFSKGHKSSTMGAGVSNFLGISREADKGTDNFLGVGESSKAADSFFRAAASSGSGREGCDRAAENREGSSDIDRFFQHEGDVCHDADSVPDTGQTAFSDLDSLLGTTQNYCTDQFSKADEIGMNIDTSMVDGAIGTGNFLVLDTLPSAEKSASLDRNSFHRGGQCRDSSQSSENCLGAGRASEKGAESVQGPDPMAEVKIEIDVADTEFVTTSASPMDKMLTHTIGDASLADSWHSHMQEGSSEPGSTDGKVTDVKCSCSDGASSECRNNAAQGRSQGVAVAQRKRFTNSDQAQSADFPVLAPWQIKVEPKSEDLSEDCSSAVWETGSAHAGQWHGGWDSTAVIDTNLPLITQRGEGHEEMDEDSTWHCSDTGMGVSAASPLVPDHSQSLRIKTEPVTLATDRVARIVSGINMERLKTGSDVSSSHSPVRPSSQLSPDFVIKMEPESDQETVINGVTDGSPEDSSSATEDEETYRKRQEKATNSRAKKPLKRPVKAKPYHCQYCDSAFAKKSRLREHTRVHTDERPYSCDLCHISFRKAESLKVHIRTHTGELPFRCTDCESAFKCSQELKRHTIRKHLAIRPFSCPECDARFFSKADLRGHSRLHTGEKPYKCGDCHAAFRKSSALTCHMRIHTGQKPYSCPQCQRAFRRSDQLKRHSKLHTGEKPYECKECQGAFTCMSDLKKHCARKHSPVKPFSCPECGNKFFTNEDLKMHRIFHMGIKPHSCSECGASFVRASDLKVHMRIHTGEKPFSCNICGGTFARSGDLRLHLRMHEDKRPFTCTVCGLSFRRSGHLTRHMNTHTGRKSFSCEDCEAAFFTSSDLKRHASRVHKKDVSKFACPQCPARFFTSRALNMHTMKHTGDRPFPCSLCGAAFSHTDLLSAHMEAHRPGEKQGGEEGETAREAGDQFMLIDVSVIPTEPASNSDGGHRVEMPTVQMLLES